MSHKKSLRKSGLRIKKPLKVGRNTMTITGEYIDFHQCQYDPTIAEGRLWYNASAKVFKFSDGVDAKELLSPPIPPALLDAVNTPQDGYVPKYNASANKFEWSQMAAGAALEGDYTTYTKKWSCTLPEYRSSRLAWITSEVIYLDVYNTDTGLDELMIIDTDTGEIIQHLYGSVNNIQTASRDWDVGSPLHSLTKAYMVVTDYENSKNYVYHYGVKVFEISLSSEGIVGISSDGRYLVTRGSGGTIIYLYEGS